MVAASLEIEYAREGQCFFHPIRGERDVRKKLEGEVRYALIIFGL